MFGKKKAQAANIQDDYRLKALSYFAVEVHNMQGSGALVWLRGGLELAQDIGLITAEEAAKFDAIGKTRYEENQKAEREERERLAAERKAARAAKAKAAKE